jgi:hypothetical protein
MGRLKARAGGNYTNLRSLPMEGGRQDQKLINVDRSCPIPAWGWYAEHLKSGKIIQLTGIG